MLEPAEQVFIQEKLKGKSATEAAMVAKGSSRQVAKVQGHRMLTSVNVQAELQKQLDKQGITIKKLITPFKDALTATKVHIVGNGDQAMAEIVTDHTVRMAAAKELLKLTGAYGKPTDDQTPALPLNTEAIQQAIEKNDTMELYRLVLSKSKSDNE